MESTRKAEKKQLENILQVIDFKGLIYFILSLDPTSGFL